MQDVHAAKFGWCDHRPSHRLPAAVLASLDFALHVVKERWSGGLQQNNHRLNKLIAFPQDHSECDIQTQEVWHASGNNSGNVWQSAFFCCLSSIVTRCIVQSRDMHKA